MKIIALLPIKNEAWILAEMLENISTWADHIIVADQKSTDESRDICAKFNKVQVIDNPHEGHSNKVRWLLLEEGRKISGNNLFVCVDADEALPSDLFLNEIKQIDLKLGDLIEADWIQLWKQTTTYNQTGTWANNKKVFAFYDDRIMDYQKVVVINDHTSRVPQFRNQKIHSLKTPLLHFQFAAWERTQWKQAWYRCNELISGLNPKRINNKYSQTLPVKEEKLTLTPKNWLEGVKIPHSLNQQITTWHEKEILELFNQYGISFFEPLQIWHIPKLQQLFIEKLNREPIVKVFPKWLVFLNKLENRLRYG